MSLPPPVSSRHQAAVHGDGGGRGATAEQQQPPGLGTERCPIFRPSEATPDMAEGGDSVGEKGEGEERDDPLVLVFALAAPALPAVVSRLDVAVPRKARSCLPRAVPSTWWSCRIPFLLPQPAKDPAEEEEEQGRMFPGPQRLSATLLLYPAAPAAKRARRCLHCDAAETPRWRPGPMGQGTLCNACGVWYSTTGALPEHRPPASPITDLLPERPIWEPEVPGAIYLVRKSEDQRRPSRTEAAQAQRPRTTCLNCGSPEPPKWREGPMGLREVCNACGVRYKKGRLLPECRPAASQMADSPPESPIADSPPESPIWKPDPRPAVYLARKPAKQRKTPTTRMEVALAPGKKKKKNRTCVHCGSSETPQWREGPMGRGTLCNACGVRYKQGRLLPEYRPMASPTFVPSEHANSHRRVLELHRKRQGKEQYPLLPLSPTFVPSKHANNRRHVPKLRMKRKCTDHNLRTSPPVNSLINPGTTCEDHPIDTPCFPSDHPANTLGCANVLVDAPSSLDSILLEGPSAPLIVESDEFVVS